MIILSLVHYSWINYPALFSCQREKEKKRRKRNDEISINSKTRMSWNHYTIVAFGTTETRWESEDNARKHAPGGNNTSARKDFVRSFPLPFTNFPTFFLSVWWPARAYFLRLNFSRRPRAASQHFSSRCEKIHIHILWTSPREQTARIPQRHALDFRILQPRNSLTRDIKCRVNHGRSFTGTCYDRFDNIASRISGWLSVTFVNASIF